MENSGRGTVGRLFKGAFRIMCPTVCPNRTGERRAQQARWHGTKLPGSTGPCCPPAKPSYSNFLCTNSTDKKIGQVPAVSPLLFWRHSTERPTRRSRAAHPVLSGLLRQGRPFHQFRAISTPRRPHHRSRAAVSFLRVNRDSRPSGLRRTASPCGGGTFLSALSGTVGRPPAPGIAILVW